MMAPRKPSGTLRMPGLASGNNGFAWIKCLAEAATVGAIVSLVSDHPEPVEHYRDKLSGMRELSHLTIEVHRCAGDH